MFEVDVLVFGVEHLIDLFVGVTLSTERSDVCVDRLIEFITAHLLISLLGAWSKLRPCIDQLVVNIYKGNVGTVLTDGLCTHPLFNEFPIQLVCAFPLILFQPLFIDICQAKRPCSTLHLCLVLDTRHSVLAILLLAIRLTLLVGFLLFHHTNHLSVGFGEINGRVDFQSEVVEIILIVVLELLDQFHALFFRQRGIIECFFIHLQRLDNLLYCLLRSLKGGFQFGLALVFALYGFVGGLSVVVE